MINVLGIGLDYLMLQGNKVRGDVKNRQFNYARRLESLTMIVYSPKSLGLKPRQWTDNLWVYPTNSRNKAGFIIDALKVATQICKERKIDVITTEDPFTTATVGCLIKRKFNLPLNIQVHIDFCDNKYWISMRRINKVFNKLGKSNLKRADIIRVGTHYEKDKLAKTLGIAKEKIFVVPVNLEVKKFQNVDGSAMRKQYLDKRFDRMILFTGRLVPQKDIPMLLKAFEIVIAKRPTTLLLIVGTGPQEDYLKRFTQELEINNNVVFAGSVEHGKIPPFVSACDVYTVSSVFEGTCIAMAEAMAAGKTVVATKFAGTSDLINDGCTGFVVEQKDYRTFAEKVLYLLNNPNKTKQMGEQASLSIQDKFAYNKNIEKMIELWETTAKV